MALQVWLPLDGNTNNQGLEGSFTFAQNSATIDNSGKIGKCYNFASTTSYGINQTGGDTAAFMTNHINNHSWSLCGWTNNTITGTTPIMCLTYGLRLFAGSNTYINLYNTSRQVSCVSSVGTNDGKWHHVCATYDVSTNAIKIYIDGIVTGATNYTSGYTYSSNWTNGIWIGKDPNNSTAANFYRGKINDVRIYDHCLSAEEVKRLSLGLVCHLPLNRNSTYTSIVYTKSSGYKIYNNYGVTASLNKLNEKFLGADVYRLSMTPTSARLSTFKNDLYSHGVYTPSSYTYKANTKYVYWIYYRPVSNSDIRAGGTASNMGGMTEIPPEYVGGGWYRVGQYRSGTVTTDKTDNIFTSYRCPSAQADVPLVCDFACQTLVEGIITPQPSINYEDTTTVYDVSGYGHNGTVSGTWANNSTTPLHNYCMTNATASTTGTSKIYISNLLVSGFSNSYSIAWWGKSNTFYGLMQWGFGDGVRLNGIYNGIFWNTGDSADNPLYVPGTTTQVSAPTTNEWHHFVMTGNGTKCYVYKDGVLWAEAKTYKTITGTKIYINGWDSTTGYSTQNLYISDFRLYATALSADDVKSLYENRL